MHDAQIRFADGFGQVVHSSTTDPKQAGLAADTQFVATVNLNRPGNRGGWLVLIMRLLSIPADYARIVPQTLRVGCDRWVQGDVLG